MTIASRSLIAVLAAASAWTSVAIGETVPARPRLGMNLGVPKDWGTELPFVDIFRFSRPWVSQQEGAPWGKGPTLDLDEHGWVRRLNARCSADTMLCTGGGGHFPVGDYTVLYKGRGRIEAINKAKIISHRPGRDVLRVDPAATAFGLRIVETDPSNYIREIRVILPGFEATYRTDPWHPTFLERWKGVDCLRYMDLMGTNNSQVVSWSQRSLLDGASYAKVGVPLELLIDLANRQGADPWFCIPHKADDDYVRHFAEMVRDRLDPRRKAYIEYSNELWNGAFKQNKEAGGRGKAMGLSDKPWEAAWNYTTVRSLEIFRIFEEVFGGHDRFVRVLASQANVPYVSKQLLEFRDAYKHVDALAIAPYISFSASKKTRPTDAEAARWSVAQLFEHVEHQGLPKALKAMREQKAVADQFGLRLIAYEGGQHFVGIQGAENNEALTKLLMAANSHPRMGALYTRYLDAWTEAGGDLFCHYNSVMEWTKWGSWGLLRYYDQDARQSPKYLATLRWAKKCGQTIRIPPSTKPVASRRP